MIYCLALPPPPRRFAQHSTPKVMRKPEKSRTVCISRTTNQEKSRQQLRHRRFLSSPPSSSRSRSPTASRRNSKSLSTETSSSPRMSRSPRRSSLGIAATPSSEMVRGKKVEYQRSMLEGISHLHTRPTEKGKKCSRKFPMSEERKFNVHSSLNH